MFLARRDSQQVEILKTSIQASQLAQASRAELGQNQGIGPNAGCSPASESTSSQDAMAGFYDAVQSPYRRSFYRAYE